MTRKLAWLMVCGAVFISGCGFQLRGDQNFAFKRLYVVGSPSPAMAVRLKRMIEGGSNTVIVTTQQQADAVLTLHESRGQGVLSLNSAGVVEEYELTNIVAYQLSAADGTVLLPSSRISLNRSLTYSDQFALAKAQESDLLYRDMENDTVDQLIRRLAVVRTLTPRPDQVPTVEQRAPLPTPPL